MGRRPPASAPSRCAPSPAPHAPTPSRGEGLCGCWSVAPPLPAGAARPSAKAPGASRRTGWAGRGATCPLTARSAQPSSAFRGLLGETAARVKGEEEAPRSSSAHHGPPAAREPAPVPARCRAAAACRQPNGRPHGGCPGPAPRKADDPDLAAFRALLTETTGTAPAPSPAPRPRRASGEPEAAPQHAAPPPAAPRRNPGGAPSARCGGTTALGFGLIVVSVPYGALRATIAHLNGEICASSPNAPAP